jgi:hypothetical protein
MSAFRGIVLTALLSAAATVAAAQEREPAEAEVGYTIELDVGAGVMLGLVPRPGVGAVAAVLIQSPWFFGLEVVSSIYPLVPQETSAGEVRWLGFFGGALVCTDAATVRGLSIRGCAGGELGFLQAYGAVDPAQSYGAGQILLRARLSYRFDLGLVIWTRPTFAINVRTDPYFDRGTLLFEAEPVGGLFDVGLGWVFE